MVSMTEPTGKLLYKTLSYSTRNPKTGIEENMYRPKHVEQTLRELSEYGWFILWAFNTERTIELILAKVEGEMTPREQRDEETKARNRELKKRGLTCDFN